jgi:dTDP-4-dehydrorhamnose 3,5-epimerase
VRRLSRRLACVATPFLGLYVVRRQVTEDQRGFFARLFCAEEFSEIGLVKPVVQINQSLTLRKGAVRGMHFQRPPHSDAKLVTCLRGEIFDVAVDLRQGSPTFLRWHGEILSADNHTSLYMPEGFAHGFQTLTDDCELIYLHTARYAPEAEGAINAADPAVGIAWPLPITEMSERDRNHPMIESSYHGLVLA